MARDPGVHFSWQNVILTTGLIFVAIGGYWTLAYYPIQESLKDLKQQISDVRKETSKVAEIQNSLYTTRLEFLAEIKRLDQLQTDNMKRREFDAWKSERDKTITEIRDRQNRFSEALDALYARLTNQAPSYRQPQ